MLKFIIDARVMPNTQPILRKTQFTFHSIRPKKNLTNAIARKKSRRVAVPIMNDKLCIFSVLPGYERSW